jgi:hypothetical protein
MGVGVAIDLGVVGIGQLIYVENSPVLTGLSFGGLGFAVIGCVYLVRRWLARTPPARVGNAATEPSPPAGPRG